MANVEVVRQRERNWRDTICGNVKEFTHSRDRSLSASRLTAFRSANDDNRTGDRGPRFRPGPDASLWRRYKRTRGRLRVNGSTDRDGLAPGQVSADLMLDQPMA